MKKILLYIILFLSGIDGAWALPIEKEGMSIYSPSLKQEVSYSIILPEGYEHSETEFKGSTKSVNQLLALMFIFFLVGLGMIVVAGN